MSIAAIFNEQMNQNGIELGPKCCAATGAGMILGLALFIIGCIGAAGAFPGSAIGWVTVGLAGGMFAINLSLGNIEKRKFDLISAGLVTAVHILMGTLGGIGVLSATQVGWAILGTSLASLPLGCFVYCLKQRELAQNQSHSPSRNQ